MIRTSGSPSTFIHHHSRQTFPLTIHKSYKCSNIERETSLEREKNTKNLYFGAFNSIVPSLNLHMRFFLTTSTRQIVSTVNRSVSLKRKANCPQTPSTDLMRKKISVTCVAKSRYKSIHLATKSKAEKNDSVITRW